MLGKTCLDSYFYKVVHCFLLHTFLFWLKSFIFKMKNLNMRTGEAGSYAHCTLWSINDISMSRYTEDTSHMYIQPTKICTVWEINAHNALPITLQAESWWLLYQLQRKCILGVILKMMKSVSKLNLFNIFVSLSQIEFF